MDAAEQRKQRAVLKQLASSNSTMSPLPAAEAASSEQSSSKSGSTEPVVEFEKLITQLQTAGAALVRSSHCIRHGVACILLALHTCHVMTWHLPSSTAKYQMELLTGCAARLLPHSGCLYMLLFDLSNVFCFGGVLSCDHRCLWICDDSGFSLPWRADYELCQKLSYRVLQNPSVHAANIAKTQAHCRRPFGTSKIFVRESAVLQHPLSCEVSKASANLPAFWDSGMCEHRCLAGSKPSLAKLLVCTLWCFET